MWRELTSVQEVIPLSPKPWIRSLIWKTIDAYTWNQSGYWLLTLSSNEWLGFENVCKRNHMICRYSHLSHFNTKLWRLHFALGLNLKSSYSILIRWKSDSFNFSIRMLSQSRIDIKLTGQELLKPVAYKLERFPEKNLWNPNILKCPKNVGFYLRSSHLKDIQFETKLPNFIDRGTTVHSG